MSETITRSEPRKALTSEDLPTLGRPITATRTASSSSALRLALAERGDDRVEQVAGAEPVRGGDGERLAEPERVELGGDREVVGTVGFVDDDEHRDVAAAQRLRQLGVAGAQAGPAVDDQQRSRRPRRSRAAPAPARRGPARPRPRGRCRRCRSARRRRPFHSVAEPLAVAGDARLGRGDRLGAADQAVDEGALADVGEADDGDGRRSSGGSMPRPPLAGEGDDAADDLFEARPVVSSSTASSAARRAPCSRSVSRASRRRWAASTVSTSSPVSAARRRARSSSEAVRKTFSGESGLTTVPMSRPSATKSPAAIRSALAGDHRLAHPGWTETREAAAVTSGARIASLTSRPPSSTRRPSKPISSPPASAPSASPSSRSTPASSAASATQRYIAPESR